MDEIPFKLAFIGRSALPEAGKCIPRGIESSILQDFGITHMNDNPSIREAAPADAAAVQACVEAAYSRYIERIGKPPGPMLDDYDAVIRQHTVFVAECEAIVAVLVLIRTPAGILLDNVAVHPGYQGKGLGKRLIRLAESEARARGYDKLELYTHECMSENIEMYESLGYTETQRKREHGYDRVYLQKGLA